MTYEPNIKSPLVRLARVSCSGTSRGAGMSFSVATGMACTMSGHALAKGTRFQLTILCNDAK